MTPGRRLGGLGRAVREALIDAVGIPADTEPRNVFVTIHENQFADWSFGDGVGQYLGRGDR